MKLNNLVEQIVFLDNGLKSEANKAINQVLTIRNWLIGYYIVNYEQNGADRAKYGAKLLQELATSLNKKGFSYRNLKLFRQFYVAFPAIGQLLNTQSKTYTLPLMNSLTEVIEKVGIRAEQKGVVIGQLPIAQFKNEAFLKKELNELQ